MIVKSDDIQQGRYYALESDSLTPISDDDNAVTYSAIKAGTPFFCVLVNRPFVLLLSYTAVEGEPLPAIEAFDTRKNKFILIDRTYFAMYYSVDIESEENGVLIEN
ncbi:MAG: hypothetical protein ACRC78_17965, partial [Planktothrix sp.]